MFYVVEDSFMNFLLLFYKHTMHYNEKCILIEMKAMKQ